MHTYWLQDINILQKILKYTDRILLNSSVIGKCLLCWDKYEMSCNKIVKDIHECMQWYL